jgi:hypothetical protein
VSTGHQILTTKMKRARYSLFLGSLNKCRIIHSNVGSSII